MGGSSVCGVVPLVRKGRDAITNLEIYIRHDGDVYVSGHTANPSGPEWGDDR